MNLNLNNFIYVSKRFSIAANWGHLGKLQIINQNYLQDKCKTR